MKNNTAYKIFDEAKEITFPIIGVKKGLPSFVATGFFIDMLGGFVTAKHVFDGKDIDDNTKYMFVHLLENGAWLPRRVSHIFENPNADISLGKPEIENFDSETLRNKIWDCDFNYPIVGEKIYTFAYPNSDKKLDVNYNDWIFRLEMFQGEIEDVHDRCPTCGIQTDCFQSNMQMLSGSSGGPVFNQKGKVIGINSLSYDQSDDKVPLSFITPISKVLEIVISSEGKMIRFGDLLEEQKNTQS